MDCEKTFTINVENNCIDWSQLVWVVVPFTNGAASASGDSGSVVATGEFMLSSGADFDGDMLFTSDLPCECKVTITGAFFNSQVDVKIAQDGNILVINSAGTSGVTVFTFTLDPGIDTVIHIDILGIAQGSAIFPIPTAAGTIDAEFVFGVV